MGEHYYGPGGEERYDADLRKARKEHLLPSVTTVLNVLNKPGLQIWKENLIYEAMYNELVSDVLDNTGEYYNRLVKKDEFIKSIKKKLKVELGKSAEEGAQIHRVIETILNGHKVVSNGRLVEFTHNLKNFIEYHKIKVLNVERSFGNYDLGYGGKIDLECEINGEHAIIDWKTKETKGKDKIKLFNEVPMQLAACAQGIWLPKLKLCTVIVSRDEPGRIDDPIFWDDNEKHYHSFREAHLLWCAIKNYNPWTGGKWF